MHILLLASLAAHAQQVVLDPGVALQGQPGTFTESGVGAPTVTWDPRLQRFIMFFETQTGPVDALCPQGRWSIGVASSEDGYAWQTWPEPVVSPTPDTPYSCYAAHPAVVRLSNGDYRLWFMAGQTTDACADGEPAWGCAVHPGIAGTIGDANVLPDVNEQIEHFEERLAEIEAEIDEIGDLIAADVARLKEAMANSPALQCENYDPICAPCPSITLEASFEEGVAYPHQHTFCQPFLLNVPDSLPVVAGNAGNGGPSSYIYFWNSYDTSETPTECWYEPAAGGNRFDLIENGHCADPVTPFVIELEINAVQSRNVTAQAPLTPTNPQILQGPDVDVLTGYEGTAANGDLTGIFTGEDDVLDVLDDLRVYLLVNVPDTPERQALLDALDTFEAELAANILALQSLRDERIEVIATLEDLSTYRPGVSFDRANLVVAAPRAGYPTVARIGGTWKMLFTYKRNIHQATSNNGVIWTADLANPALKHGTTTWDQDELFSPSLNCTDEFGPQRHIAFYGGRDTITNIPGDPVADAALGDGLSFDFNQWFSATQELAEWDDSDRWRHWDMLRSGAGWRVWLGERDASGQLVVRTGRIGNPSGTGGGGRICD